MANQMLEQMLEHLVNDEQDKAEELFHEYVVAKSREIYEGLVEDQWDEEVVEADDDEDMMGGDPTDDLEDEVTDDEEMDMDMDDDEDDDEEDTEELFQDLEDIVGELEAKFAELQGDDMDGDDMDGDEKEESLAFEADEDDDEEDDEQDEMDESFEDELASLREYVEKVSGGASSSETTADHKKSVVDNMKNDMGGTSANILSDTTDEKGRSAPTAKEEDMGNVNVPGGKASKSMKSMSKGHGAEKKGAGENADNTDSVLRSQR
jgi:hypothetical protein